MMVLGVELVLMLDVVVVVGVPVLSVVSVGGK